VVSTNLWASPDAALKTVLANMATGFDGQLLRLPVEERANIITLALDRSYTRRELQALRPRAQDLENHFRLDLPKQLRTLVHHNSGLMRRFLDLRTA
jgi:spermidine synthase